MGPPAVALGWKPVAPSGRAGAGAWNPVCASAGVAVLATGSGVGTLARCGIGAGIACAGAWKPVVPSAAGAAVAGRCEAAIGVALEGAAPVAWIASSTRAASALSVGNTP